MKKNTSESRIKEIERNLTELEENLSKTNKCLICQSMKIIISQ